MGIASAGTLPAEVVYRRQQSALLSVAAAKRAIDEQYGIIPQLLDLMIEPDDPRLFNAVTKMTNTERLFGSECYDQNGGAGLTEAMAQASAIGETLERYCSGIYRREELTIATYAELRRQGVNATAPASFALFSESQYDVPGFPFHRFTEDTIVAWVEGVSLVTGETTLVPASFVYVPYRYEMPSEHVSHGVSTGLCCALSFEDAVLGGVLEAVERDAFMIMWMNSLASPRLDPTSAGWLAAVYDERFRALRHERGGAEKK